MRRLEKDPPPQVLRENEVAWTLEYVAARTDGEKHRGYWGHDEIRDALGVEVEEKCAYCESYVKQVSYEHVEHIRPKGRFPDLAHRWPNLTVACQVCNTNKGEYCSAELPVINPYYDDPLDYLRFIGAMVLPRDDNGKGNITYEKLQLYRWDLTNARERRLTAITQMYLRWRSSSPEVKEAVASGIVLDAQHGEYTVAVREMLRHLDFPRADDIRC